MMQKTCRLWTDPDLALSDRLTAFERVEPHGSGSREERALLRCTCCGRLYVWEYRDDIDRDAGRDPSWETFVPVSSTAEADLALTEPPGSMSPVPRLHHDRPSTGPRRTRWIGRPGSPFRREGAS